MVGQCVWPDHLLLGSPGVSALKKGWGWGMLGRWLDWAGPAFPGSRRELRERVLSRRGSPPTRLHGGGGELGSFGV